jgi:hypothetical protein
MFGKKKQKEETEEKKEIKNPETEKVEKTELSKEDIREKLSQGYLKVHLIFEVVGKPAEFIEEAIHKLIALLEKEVDIHFLDKKIGTAKPYVMKTESGEQADLFSTYAEVEILVINLKRLTQIIFDYMPSSVEIFEPIEIKLKTQDSNLLLNELAVKLHEYDLSNKKLVFQRNALFKKLQELQKKK